ncbi:O171 family O-antigen polymerase, partial [Escherichia coli]
VILFSTTHIYFFIFCIYKYKIDGFINENTFNELFWQSSRNIVSAILLLTTIFFLAVNYIEQKKIYLSVLFINMISSILLYGRSGVVLSFIVLFIGIYLKFFKEEKNVIKIILFLFFSI